MLLFQQMFYSLLNHPLLYFNTPADDFCGGDTACLHVLHKLKHNYTIRWHRIHPHAHMNIDLEQVEMWWRWATLPLAQPQVTQDPSIHLHDTGVIITTCRLSTVSTLPRGTKCIIMVLQE